MKIVEGVGEQERNPKRITIDKDQYPVLGRYAVPLLRPAGRIIGREAEKQQVLSSLNRPRLSNLLLLAPAGSGKTVLVQETMLADPDRVYLEVDPARMVSAVASPDQMAGVIKELFDDAERFGAEQGQELVLFIDEFHQIVQMSPAAVEALKPVLAASGTRGLKIIAATTYEEWITYIRPNKPLDERLQRVNLAPADKEATVAILRSFAEEEGVLDLFYTNGTEGGLLEEIVEITDRYVPSSVQPRKSINVLDGMIGWHRQTGAAMDLALVDKVLYQSTGMSLLPKADGVTLKETLDSAVFAQDLATTVVSDQLQLVIANLNDPSKPKGRFLFTGSTGVGKSTAATTLVAVTDGSTDGLRWKTHGELEVGDYVFDRQGNPTEVLGIFPQGVRDIYRVTFTDGRSLDVDGEHLWTVYTAKQRAKKNQGFDVTPMTLTTHEILDRGVVRTYPGDSREHMKFFIPANGAVAWPERKLTTDPYVMGVLIGNGCLGNQGLPALMVSSDDEYTVSRVADHFGCSYKGVGANGYSWVFPTGEKRGDKDSLLSLKSALLDTPELVGCYSRDRRIPQAYMTGSIEQRWELVRGLFDTDGTIGATGGRFNVSYSTFSKGLAADVRQLLFSLGVSNTVNCWTRTKTDEDGVERELVEYDVHVKIGNEDKAQLFSLPRKREIAERAVIETSDRERVKKFDMVGIKSIEKLAEPADAVCILVDNEEHLYQAGEHFVVTHNTELAKQMGKTLFPGDQNRLIRFDMSEFALDDSLTLFRSELTKKVVSMGDCIILLDEIEKASRMVLRLMLQVLDDGRLSDDDGRQVSFLKSYIILTTNAGSEVYNTISDYSADDTGDGTVLKEYMKAIENSIKTANDFPPELLGRLDRIVPFQPLSKATRCRILNRGLKKLQEDMRTKHGVRLGISPRVLKYLAIDVSENAADAGGARESMRVLTGQVTVEVAKFINANPGEKVMMLDIAGEMRAENLDRLKSAARPVVLLPGDLRAQASA